MMQLENWALKVSISALATSVFMLGACSSDPLADDNILTDTKVDTREASAEKPTVLSSNWDGKTMQEADQIVTLRLAVPPISILLNGEPAQVKITKGKADILIVSDDTGISCENTYLVTFEGGKKGQLLANHCHDEPIFAIEPGQNSKHLVTKQEVDNPEDDMPVSEGVPSESSIAVGWGANGFVQLSDRYEWMGGTGEDPFLSLSVPETDDTVWVSRCDNGALVSMIFVNDTNLAEGASSTLKVETDVTPLQSYIVKAEESGMGPAYQIRNAAGNGPLKQMVKGDWLYLQMGEGDGAGKVRISLDGAREKAATMLKSC